VFGHVSWQVLDRDVVVGPVDGPFQLTEERFHTVGRVPVDHVLASGVVHDLVLRSRLYSHTTACVTSFMGCLRTTVASSEFGASA